MAKSHKESRVDRGTRSRSGPSAGGVPSGPLEAAASAVPGWARWVLPLSVIAVTFVTFVPALQNEFVNWDDDKVLLENYGWRGLGGPQLRWMFTSGVQGHYHPLTWVSFAIDYLVWGGLDPGGFHLTNVLWHALNAALFYLLALRLLQMTMPGGGGPAGIGVYVGAAFAALLFGVHPLRVESVAWVTERRDVLSTFFLMACLLFYLRYATQAKRGGGWYVASVVMLTLSLLSKAWGITLPVVLLVLDFHPLRRLRWGAGNLITKEACRAYLDKIPFALLAAWAAYLAAKVQASLTIMKPLAEHGLLERAAQSLYGLAFYPLKTLVPAKLAPIYEIPVDMDPFAPRFVVAAVAVVVVTVMVIALRRRWPAALALWACYVVVLSPVLGLAQSGPQLVADRYSYVSCMTWALAGGAGLTWCLRALRAAEGRSEGRLSRWAVGVVSLAAVAAVLVLAGLTWRQTQVWRTSRALWEHTLAVRPDSWNAHVNIGVLYRGDGESNKALGHLNAALAMKPDIAEAHANIAPILADQGREAEALEHVRRLRELLPGPSLFLGNVGVTLFKLGRTEEAIEAYHESLRGWPDDPVTHLNLAVALQQQGDPDGAIEHLVEVVELIEALEVMDEATAQSTRYGEAYVQACRSLRALYHHQGDRPSAKRYGQKLRALGLGKPR